MNAWQLLRQIKTTLEDATWPDGATEPVFGEVVCSAGFPREGRLAVRMPLARVTLTSLTDDNQGLLIQGVEVEVTQSVRGDRTGEVALIGGTRSAGQGSSSGRGLTEIEEVLYTSLAKIARLEGIQLRLDLATAAAAGQDAELGYLAWRTYEFSAWVTQARTYPAPTRFRGSDTGGDATLLWSLPPSRYDLLGLILRRASGSTAPAAIADGTGVALAVTDTTVVDTLSSGTYSYSLWASYDETGAGAADRYSDPVTLTVVVA